MIAKVVDTNVLATANGYASHANLDCVSASIDALRQIMAFGKITLDENYVIYEQYETYSNYSGQSRVGDVFFKWVYTNMWNDERCDLVTTTPRVDDPTNFNEFPDDPDLESFDEDDRVFVAVARASDASPSILNAVDRGWWEHRAALERHGVQIIFLCPDMMTPATG